MFCSFCLSLGVDWKWEPGSSRVALSLFAPDGGGLRSVAEVADSCLGDRDRAKVLLSANFIFDREINPLYTCRWNLQKYKPNKEEQPRILANCIQQTKFNFRTCSLLALYRKLCSLWNIPFSHVFGYRRHRNPVCRRWLINWWRAVQFQFDLVLLDSCLASLPSHSFTLSWRQCGRKSTSCIHLHKKTRCRVDSWIKLSYGGVSGVYVRADIRTAGESA